MHGQIDDLLVHRQHATIPGQNAAARGGQDFILPAGLSRRRPESRATSPFELRSAAEDHEAADEE